MRIEPVARRRRALKFLFLLVLSTLLVSCETLSYYSQAVRGQLAIVFAREDIQQLLRNSDLDPTLARRFEEVLALRNFAEQSLLLPVGEHYSTYVDVGREHVVWNVFAAPEFSTDPLSWCYPIAGCVSYRGYFSEQGATRFASQLEAEGYDVYTGGVDAYSTLGWFEDSLLNTVLNRESYQLAGLIFHELAHQLVYVPGDTTFNESFATAVEHEGIERWLRETGRVDLVASAEQDQRRQRQFVALVSDYQERFASLYEQPLSEPDMRREKQHLQETLRQDYMSLKQDWNGYAGYDAWFSRSLNNAQLSTVSSYNDLVPFFEGLLNEEGGDLQAFYSRVQEIAGLEDAARDSLLQAYR